MDEEKRKAYKCPECEVTFQSDKNPNKADDFKDGDKRKCPVCQKSVEKFEEK